MLEKNIFNLLKILRKNKTQREMSKALGVKADDYHKWEAGYKKIKLNEFIKLLNFNGYDFEKICNEDFSLIKKEKNTADFIKQLENHFPCDLNQFLNSCNFSESKWWRLKNTKNDITLIDFFKIIHYRSFLLYRLFERLEYKDYQLDHTTHARDNRAKLFNTYMLKYNYFAQLTAAIYLVDIKAEKKISAKAKLISNIIPATAEEVELILNNLLRENILYFDKNNELDFATFENNYNKEQKLIGKSIYTNIFKNAQKMDQENLGDAKFFYRVAPVTEETFTKIQELQAKLSKEIYNLIINDPPNKRTTIINTLACSHRSKS